MTMLSWSGSLAARALGLGMVTACALDAPVERTTATCPAALRSAQGTTLNGLSPQGLSPQGLSPQGFSPQGLSPQGLSPQGLSPQGLWANGLQAQGLTAQGLTAQGLWANGLWANGLTTEGLGRVDPAALRGIALTGLTEEQATSWAEGSTAIAPENVIVLSYLDGVLGGFAASGVGLAPKDLTGALLPALSTQGKVLWIAIAAVGEHPTAPDLPLYTLTLGGQNVCREGVGGLFVPGVWDETGKQRGSVTADGTSVATTFSCTTGVIAKCVAWGYRPWTEGAAIHEACTRMARADYCGNGVPHTEEGTTIDVFDVRGIQVAVSEDGLTFEAGWGPDGAVCVREPRYVDTTPSGKVVYPSCWAALPKCENVAEATELGAELGNDSRHTLRHVACD